VGTRPQIKPSVNETCSAFDRRTIRLGVTQTYKAGFTWPAWVLPPALVPREDPALQQGRLERPSVCSQVVLAFLLFPVARQTVTVLRNTPLRYIIPFGAVTCQCVSYTHVLCSWTVFTFGMVHSPEARQKLSSAGMTGTCVMSACDVTAHDAPHAVGLTCGGCRGAQTRASASTDGSAR